MCSHSHGVGQQLLPITDHPPRSSFLQFNPNPNNRVISYRTRPGPGPIRCSLNDVVSEERRRQQSQSMSFYELLGIPQTGSLIKIKQAYKQQARKYHPDVSPPGRAEEYTQRFLRVQEAYETLSDPRMREWYDRDMAKGLHLAFTARSRTANFDQQMDEKSEWKNRWQSQLSELKKRSMQKDSDDNMSWGAKMRTERNE